MNYFVQSPLLQATRLVGNKAGLEYDKSHRQTPDKVSEFIDTHPYASAIGYKVPVGGASYSIGSRAMGSPLGATMSYRLASAPMEMVAGRTLHRKLEKDKTFKGIGGRFSKKHPLLGPALTSWIPGLGINANVAGEELAQKAVKSKNFMYKNPEASALLASLVPIPGVHRSHAHAATVIRDYKKNKKANVGTLLKDIADEERFLGLGDIVRNASKTINTLHDTRNGKLVSRAGGSLMGYHVTEDPKYTYMQRAGAIIGGGVAGDLLYRTRSPLLKLIESKKQEAIKESMLREVVESAYRYAPVAGVSAALLSKNRKD